MGERTDPIRVAIVGLGIGRLQMIGFAEQSAHYRVTTVCDLDEDRAREVAGWLKDVRATTSLDEVLADDDVDLVSLCTPPALHREQVEACLRAGKDVFCEKPLVGTVAEVDELEAVAAETGRRVMPILQYRFGRGVQRLHRLEEAGLSGRRFVANVEMAWLRGPDYYAVPWRLDPVLGGTVLSHALHAIDLALLVLGAPASVFARTATLVNDVPTEDSAAVVLGFDDGSLATLSVTLGSVAELSRHRFTFEHLSAESGTNPYDNGADPWTYSVADTPEGQRVQAWLDADATTEPEPEAYSGQFARYATATAAGEPPPVRLQDARNLLLVVDAIHRSAATERPVTIEGWRP